ncbi:MAG: GH116 family glycosyl hydrolase [Bacteroidales bacterium]|nr:GH116 family glycosyl hydrolase [Bacteroidales bacterium]
MKKKSIERVHVKTEIRRAIICCAVSMITFLPFAARSQSNPLTKQTNSSWINVSESLGFPLGGIGTGYSAFGRYGFVRVNFDGRPYDGLDVSQWEYNMEYVLRNDTSFQNVEEQWKKVQKSDPPLEAAALEKWKRKYENAARVHQMATAPEGFVQSSYGFTLSEGDQSYLVQTTPANWNKKATPFKNATVMACLPKGLALFTDEKAKLQVSVSAFTPLIPHDLENSTLPVQVYDVTVRNSGKSSRQFTLSLENGIPGTAATDRTVFTFPSGEMVFAADGATASEKDVSVMFSLAPGRSITKRFYISWYFPKIGGYKRYYTTAMPNGSAVIDKAMKEASQWSTKIDAWHRSVQVPAYLKRVWFGSLASIMTSTFMTTDPYFFEIETPHGCLNTMDVCVYSGWVYMINWPELERMDMNQFFKATPRTGENAGLIMHSLWNDAAHYVEEPTFMCRMRRDALWYNDPAFTREGFDVAVLAANRVYNLDNYENLIQSKHGNQSYDAWKMPGVSSYVNSAWIYGLDALKSMAAGLGKTNVTVGSVPLEEMLTKARASYEKLLWNPQTKCWNLFYRTEGSSQENTPETLFTDQLFGQWVAAIDRNAKDILPSEKIKSALTSLYINNQVEDKKQNFRGWVNGMKPNRVPDYTINGYHARTCWFGAQINLSSLLGYVGNELASIDIMRSIDMSLKNNHFAAGEWNGSINAKGEILPLPDETAKDTPRFAPYPRYKSSWEYLIRLLGLQMDEKSLYLQPFKTVDFRFGDIQLAGKKMNITVQAGWNRVLVDGKKVSLPVSIPRTSRPVKVEFLK